ncbi:MAG: aminoacyl-tRNA hydrolase [Treponema sp.]|jgi:PTH1 family peptidyl-tRNA hydrolase|nr:aminoacyl-tRNA hydrolase [Treponema sp.]
MVDLVVFLGNPGRQYERNRHNVGWLFAERLPFYGSLLWQKKFKGLYAQAGTALLAAGDMGVSVPRNLHFLKPETFMNASGDSAAAAAAFFRIDVPSILVVHDELELPLGTVSLKCGGGLGGHNGLRSLKASLGTDGFWRLRFGIGRPDDRAPGQGGPPGSGKGIVEWVLSDFSAAEDLILDQVFAAAAAVFTGALAGEPAALLPEWGKKRLTED